MASNLPEQPTNGDANLSVEEDAVARKHRLEESAGRQAIQNALNWCLQFAIYVIPTALVIGLVFVLFVLVLQYFTPWGWLGIKQVESIEGLTSQPAFGYILGTISASVLSLVRKRWPSLSSRASE